MTENEILLRWSDLSPSPLNALVRGDEGAEADIEELAASIAEEGVVQPLVVVETPGQATPYGIVAGERRWRAARRLGDRAPLLPCRVRPPMDELDQLVLMGVENLQRRNLGPMAEARYYQALVERGLDEKAIARRTGARLSRVKQMLGLLRHPEPVQDRIDAGQLPLNAARHLAKLPAAQQVELADRMTGRPARDIKLAVRLAQQAGHNGRRPAKPGKADQIKTLRQLCTLLVAQLRADALLLQQCADALVEVDSDLSATAFERSQTILGRIKRWVK